MDGLPDLMTDLVGCGPVATLDTARQMYLMIGGVVGLPELMVVHVAEVAR